MFTTLLILTKLLKGATPVPAGSDTFGGFITHAVVYAFFNWGTGEAADGGGIIYRRRRRF